MGETQSRIATEPVPHLIVTLGFPAMISQLVSQFYSLADTYFVSSLGVSASGATGIVFTLLSLLYSVGMMLGQGAGSLLSRRLALGKVQEASCYASTSFFFSVACGLLVALVCGLLVDPLMVLLGSTPTILLESRVYGLCIILSAPVIISSFVLNMLLRFEGLALVGMLGLCTGCVLNVAGDAWSIEVMHWGILGAGLSTALSQLVSLVILVVVYRKRSSCRLSLACISKKIADVAEICRNGIPALVLELVTVLSNSTLYNLAGNYGDACVSALSIVARCQSFVKSVGLGFGQGFQPMAGFSYVSKRYARLREGFWFTVVLCVGLVAMLAVPIIIGAPFVMAFFQNESQVIAYGTVGLRMTMLGLFALPFSLVPGVMFQSCGLVTRATVISVLRGGGLLIVVALLLNALFGVQGLLLAQGISDYAILLFTVSLTLTFFKKLPAGDQAAQ